MSFELERPALYLKRPGVVHVGRTYLQWTPDSAADGKGVSIPYGSIRGCRVTTAKSKKAMMNISADAKEFPKGVIFDFRKEFADRDTIRDALNQKLYTKKQENGAVSGESGAAKSKETAEIPSKQFMQKMSAEKQKWIRAVLLNREVWYLHRKLVGGALISEEEFWKAMNYRYDASGQKRQAWHGTEVDEVTGKKGMSSSLNGTALGDADGDDESQGPNGGTKKIIMSEARKHAIFVEFPAVERAFKDQILSKRSEERKTLETKFWNKFFQSSMGGNNRVSIGINDADEFFAPYQEEEAVRFDKDIHERARKLDIDLNIDRFDDHKLPHVAGGVELENKDAARTAGEHIAPSKSLSLLRQVNRHGTRVVENTVDDALNRVNNERIPVWHEDEEAKNHPLPDLEVDENGHFAPLQLRDQKVYFEAQAMAKTENNSGAVSLTPEFRALAGRTLEWTPNLAKWTTPQQSSEAILLELLKSMQ